MTQQSRKIILILVILLVLPILNLINQRNDGLQISVMEQMRNDLFISMWDLNGTPVCTLANQQSGVEMCSDNAGGVIIAWMDWRNNSNQNIYAQRFNELGQYLWTANGIPVCTASGEQTYHQICSDGSGGAIIVWTDPRNGPNMDIYAQRINATGYVQWTIDGIAVCTADNIQREPRLIRYGIGGVIITWIDKRSENFNIYAQRINSTGHSQWGPNGTVICVQPWEQRNVLLSNTTDGNIILTWHDTRHDGIHYDIYAQKINASGHLQWDPLGVPICTETGDQTFPQIYQDSANGSFITWIDQRNGIWGDIYAQRVNATGHMLWTPNGTAVCTSTEDQTTPWIVNDGLDGAIITWYDRRSKTNYDIYAQKLNSTGQAQWTTNGTPICTAKNDQLDPVLIQNQIGGAILTWIDQRTGNPDIFTQWINSTGSPQWAPNGTAVCTAKDVQWAPRICTDGHGGAFIAWYDHRNGTEDIYIHRVVPQNYKPYVTGPTSIATPQNGFETINWMLYDDYNSGFYRVWVTASEGPPSLWVNWWAWSNATEFHIAINRVQPGVYNYTLEYCDLFYLFGDPNSVTVIVTKNSFQVPGFPFLFIIPLILTLILLKSAPSHFKFKSKWHLNK